MDSLKNHNNASRTERVMFNPWDREEGRGGGELRGRKSNANDYVSSYAKSTIITF
jgi:hypothetical protein